MTGNFKFFFIALFLGLPFWWGANLLEKNLNDVFYWQEISQNQKVFAAQITLEEQLRGLKPFRNREVNDLLIQAKSAVSVLLDDKGREKFLFAKETDQQLPIASLTKLMTALVVTEYYNLENEVRVSKEAIGQEGDFGKLEAGQIFPVEYLLYPLLMESSNDAAFSLADDYEGMDERKFVELMKWEAEKLGMHNTFFDNPTGLDPEESGTRMNYSTASDLTKLIKEILKKPLILEILQTQRYSLYGPELINSNELLGGITGIIGGKTGYTGEAGGCMILVTEAPQNQGYLVNVILGANGTQNRFREMEKLVDWVEIAYKW